LLIHKVGNGENLAGIADQYKTSVDAIQTVNYNLQVPVWINWLLVVPVGTTQEQPAAG
jgi:hypothetical protein